MQRTAVTGERVGEERIGRMHEERNAELLATRVERLEPGCGDIRIVADAARDVDADQAQAPHRIFEHVERNLRIGQRHRRRGPETPGMRPHCRGHRFVPLNCVLFAFGGRHVGKMDRKRADRPQRRDMVPQRVHVLKMAVQIVPDGRHFEHVRAAGRPIVVEPAFAVGLRPRIALTLTEQFEKRPRPPMKMRLNNFHGQEPPRHSKTG